MNNVVDVHIRFPDAAIEAQVRDRFADTGWMHFTYDGPPPWQGPVGGLDVTVVDRAGKAIPVDCLVGATDPRVADERTSYGAEGRCAFEDLASVTWTLRIDYDLDGEHHTALQQYAIPPGGVLRDKITIEP